MKSLLLLIFFVCVRAQVNVENLVDQSIPSNPNEIVDEVTDDVLNDDETVERPCQVSETDCIRKFLHEHSHCRLTYGNVPDPLYRPEATQQISRINLTISATGLNYRRLNGQINEFYVNKKNNQLVLAVEFTNANFATKNAFFFFYRRAKEPIITNDFYNITLTSVVVTAVIPGIHNLRYDRSEQFTYSNDPTGLFVIGPNLFNSKDPYVQEVVVALFQNIPSNIREIVLTEGPFFMANFIQYTLCDFGLKLL